MEKRRGGLRAGRGEGRMAVKRFIGKVFYPVIYEGEAADAAGALEQAAVTNNKQKEVPVFTPSSQRCEEMRWGVSQLLCAEESGLRIGRVFEAARREVFFWPKNNKGLFFCPRAGERVPIALTGLRILVFETKIAFFEMDFELQNLPLTDAMNATYYLCEPKDEANHFEYENRVFDPETRQTHSEPAAFTLMQWFLKCAEFLPGCRNFENRPLASTTSKPLLYGYYLLDEKPQNFEAVACNIAQNYKLSYKNAADNARDHVLETFENSCWCASYNGAVNVSFAVGEEGTDRFFETTFPHKWATEYLLLFIATIHQKYAVQKYLDDLGELACPHYDYDLMWRLLQQGEIMQEKCTLLKNRCFFQLPSHVEHVNRVYNFLQWCFDIPGYTASLDEEVENSVSVCKSYISRIKNIEDLEKQLRGIKNEMSVALITASITCLTFFNSAYTTLRALFSGNFGEIGVSAVVLTGTFLATIIGAVYKLFAQADDIREVREKLDKLKGQVVSR